MAYTDEQLVLSLKQRKPVSRWGIGTALQYLRCVDAKDFNVSPDKWAEHLKAAESQFTYCDEGYETKGFKDGAGLIDGAVLEFDGICSTRNRDRDGDVIDSKGLEIDHSMPLLFAHAQASPVGKHVSLIEQDDTKWASHWAIADTMLGKDCATLVKFGSLRLSIGFKPTELVPLTIEQDSAGQKFVTGWHIKKALVVETSLVSVPANSDASIYRTYAKELSGICDAVGKGLLKHDAVKHWAKSLSDMRPVIVPGATLKDETLNTKDTGGGELPTEMPDACEMCGEKKLDETGTCQACGHVKGTKAAGELVTKDTEVVTKGLSHYPSGSFEQTQFDLGRTARKYLLAKGAIDADEGYGWADLYATFTDKAVVSLYEGEGKYECYSIGYKMDGGKAVWDGEPTEVNIEPAILAKHFAGKVATKDTAVVTKEVTKEVVVEKVVERLIEPQEKSLAQLAIELSGRAIKSANQEEADAALQIVAKTIEAQQHSRGLIQI